MASLDLNKYFAGDALKFACDVLEIVGAYDDIIDEPLIIHDHVHSMMWKALVELPRNPFYRQYFDVLNPLIMSAITSWRIANELQNEQKRDDLHIAFIIRSEYVNLFQMMAIILHGPNQGVQIGQEMRRIIHDEGYAAFEQEMKG